MGAQKDPKDQGPQMTPKGTPKALRKASQNGTQKNIVLFWKWFPNPEYGESRDPNRLYGVLEAFGRAGLPPNAPE